MRYWQIKTLYCYCDLSESSKVKGHCAKGKIIYMLLSINNSNYMSNSKLFKDIGTFLWKKLMRSHVTRNALDDPKSSAVFCAWFYRIFWSKPEVSIFKNGWDMANLTNFMFCNITWPKMHWLTPKFKFFIRNLYPTKMHTFINLGRIIIFLKFCDVTVTL